MCDEHIELVAQVARTEQAMVDQGILLRRIDKRLWALVFLVLAHIGGLDVGKIVSVAQAAFGGGP